ncbi:hypothetical protein [Haloarcula onubensis]|uniref:Uncharacterized protein n=1 Tax=Haloarcula onubensis TaxID=2950539 RepID=A0ABU2FN22_9EURY|nr:hypothetical protein [Halomicroarcula sp. S3CR25-11]MDS0282150.1 hypothetical protein [Halomicroarcula sp. S3CR25-11]
MDDIDALRLPSRRCTAILVAAIGLAIVGLTTGEPVVGYLLGAGGLAALAVGSDALGRRFAAPSDTDADEPGT